MLGSFTHRAATRLAGFAVIAAIFLAQDAHAPGGIELSKSAEFTLWDLILERHGHNADRLSQVSDYVAVFSVGEIRIRFQFVWDMARSKPARLFMG